MGIEYKIKFQIKNKTSIERFLERNSETFGEEVFIKLEENGFYFCDNCYNSPVAASVFYRLVNEALSQSNEVAICEL